MKSFQEIQEWVSHRFDGVPFIVDNHISVVCMKPDEACLRMDIQSRQFNQHGILHGGYTLLLADCAAGIAALTDGRDYVTQSQSFAFIQGVPGGSIYASGKVISRRRSVVVVHVEIKNESGELIGDGSFNMYTIHKASREDAR